MGGTRYCCVVGCTNSQSRNRELTFYSFPGRKWEVNKRNEWIKAVRRITSDNQPWQPNKNTRICSDHFIGGKQSNLENSPSYIPTIFHPVHQKKVVQKSAIARHERLLERRQRKTMSEVLEPQETESLACDIEVGSNKTTNKVGSTSVGCQTDACDYEEDSPEGNNFWSWNNDRNEASTQTNIYISKPNKNNRIVVEELKTFDTKLCGLDDIVPNGFSGFCDIKTDEDMLQLGGVTQHFFDVLLDLIDVKADGQPAYYRVLNKQNQLLLFLMKMKLDISFSDLACIFNVQESTASQIFIETLSTLSEKTKTWIFWPSRKSIENNLPVAFKKYQNCRCIINCMEIFTATQPTAEQRVLMYSNDKSSTVKYLTVITPDGFICQLSKGYGGNTTDSYITNDCGLLQFIESGDTVFADKSFPQIKSELLKRNAVLVIPPEAGTTYNIASVRIHVERAIQRIKLCNILNLIPITLFPYLDAIMHMCCVIANSKPPLINDTEAAS